jgi:hypothetical protein
MPWLSSQKRTLAGKTVEGGCCPEFDVRVFGVDCIIIGGVIVNAIFKVLWADFSAALLLLPIIF